MCVWENILHVLKNDSKTSWSTEILKPFLRFFSNNLLENTIIFYSFDNFEKAYKTCSILFWGAVPPQSSALLVHLDGHWQQTCLDGPRKQALSARSINLHQNLLRKNQCKCSIKPSSNLQSDSAWRPISSVFPTRTKESGEIWQFSYLACCIIRQSWPRQFRQFALCRGIWGKLMDFKLLHSLWGRLDGLYFINRLCR